MGALAGRAVRRPLRPLRAAARTVRRRVQLLRPGCGECPICGTVAQVFDHGGHPTAGRPDCQCPGCGSLERHRAIWLHLTSSTSLLTGRQRVLHLAPDKSLRRGLRRLPRVAYISADLDPTKARACMDITGLALRDHALDLVLVSHVLEHVPDDLAAMRELHRVLAPGGRVVLAVPMWRAVTAEDLSIVDPDERRRRFGQNDHVRSYGLDGVFEERLTSAGFDVSAVLPASGLSPKLQRRYRLLPEERIHSCTPRPPSLR